MEALSSLLSGFAVVLTPLNLALMFTGIVLGVIIGVLPGLGGANGVAILLPLTFAMSPTSAIIMLSCIYWGALFGGAITSILFNIPGEPWSVATTFDGHPMAQQGRADEALTGAFTSSFVLAELIAPPSSSPKTNASGPVGRPRSYLAEHAIGDEPSDDRCGPRLTVRVNLRDPGSSEPHATVGCAGRPCGDHCSATTRIRIGFSTARAMTAAMMLRTAAT